MKQNFCFVVFTLGLLLSSLGNALRYKLRSKDALNSFVSGLSSNTGTTQSDIQSIATSQVNSQNIINNESCIKTYLEKCPLNWSVYDENDTTYWCFPNKEYKGTCKGTKVSSLTKTQKETLEDNCDISWPCTNDNICTRDYTVLCPLGFSEIDLGKCSSTILYEGSCNTSNYNFGSFSANDKMNWALQCNTNWPCKSETTDCLATFNPFCPIGWNHIGNGECQRVSSKKLLHSGCSNSNINFLFWNTSMKTEYAINCIEYWPCRNHDCINYNIDNPCPEKWNNDESGNQWCISPQKEYLKLTQENTVMNTDFNNLPIEGICTEYIGKVIQFKKENILEEIKRCKLKWECKKQCEPDWTKDCPSGYTKNDSKCNLNSTSNVISMNSGQVKQIESISISTIATENDKRRWASDNLILWACGIQ